MAAIPPNRCLKYVVNHAATGCWQRRVFLCLVLGAHVYVLVGMCALISSDLFVGLATAVIGAESNQ